MECPLCLLTHASTFIVQGVLLSFLRPRPLLCVPLLVPFFPASPFFPRSQGLSNVCAPDASGLLRQLLNCHLRELMQLTFNMLVTLRSKQKKNRHPFMNGKFFSQQLGSIRRKHKQVGHSHRPKGQRDGTDSLDCLSPGAGRIFKPLSRVLTAY